MNIFHLSRCPIQSAQMQCDTHVVKMILETAQLLSTAHHVLDGDAAIGGIYKKTHMNHPSAIWARETSGNYRWLYCHFVALCDEYTHRYGKTHLTQTKLKDILYYLPTSIKHGDQTPIAQCMPDDYKVDSDPVTAYRSYYIGAKSDIANWNKARPAPAWFEAEFSM
tara:strand:+ start:77 stop:574 length:498 start_codon:yes stop_codon:yes gene_type:complete